MGLTTLIGKWRTKANAIEHEYVTVAPTLLRQCANELESALQEAGQPSTDWTKITRIEVIGPTGREHARRDITVQSSMQDNGRTLKLFIAPLPVPPVDRGRGDE